MTRAKRVTLVPFNPWIHCAPVPRQGDASVGQLPCTTRPTANRGAPLLVAEPRSGGAGEIGPHLRLDRVVKLAGAQAPSVDNAAGIHDGSLELGTWGATIGADRARDRDAGLCP